jgi:hypothetical protein
VQKGKTQYRSLGISGIVIRRFCEDKSINMIEYIVSALGRTTPTAPGSFGSGEAMIMLGFKSIPFASKGLATSPYA